METTIKLSGIVRNLPDNTVPDGAMHELINLRPKDGALRPVGQKTPVTLAAEDIRFIHRISSTVITYIGGTEQWHLSYWVSVNGVLGPEIVSSVSKPSLDLPIVFSSLKNTVMVSTHGIQTEEMSLMVFDESTNTYNIFNSTDRFLPRDIPNFMVQRVAVAGDDDSEIFEAPYTMDLSKALLGEYVKMQRKKENDGYLSGKVLIRFAWEMFDGTMVKHSIPDLTRTSDLAVSYEADSALFGGNGGWKVTTAFAAYKLQIYLAGTYGWLEAFQAKYANIIRSLKIYVSRPKSPEEDVTKDERFESIIKDNDGLVGKMLNKIERVFDVADLKDYSPDPETEQFYLLKEIKLSELTASIWIDIIDITADDVSVQDLSTRAQLPIDNFSHHQLYANRLFTYNERIFLGDIKNTLLWGMPVTGWLSSRSVITGANYEVAIEFEVIVEGNKTLKTLTSYSTINYYSNTNPADIHFALKWQYVPGGGMLGEYGYFGFPDARATRARIIVRRDYQTRLAATVELTSIPAQNYSIAKGLDIEGLFSAWPLYTTQSNPLSWSYYDTNRVQATELNNPFCFPAINSYRLGLGQVLGFSTNAIALSQGQFGQFPVFVFCSDGIWTMNIGTGETLISTITNISRLICSNPEAITPIDGGTAFPTSKGLFIIIGASKPELSQNAEGKHTSRITSLAAYDTVSSDANYYQIRSLLCQTDFLSYLAGAVMGYDYQHNEIIVSNITYPYSWVFSIENKLWFKISEPFRRFVNDYPVCYGIKEEEEITTTTPAPTTTDGPTTSEPPTTTIPPTTTLPPTTTEAPTTTVAPTTTSAPTTTEAATTTEAPVGGFGRHYNWYAATDPRNIAAVDWHLPSYTEYRDLMRLLDPDGTTYVNDAGKLLKESGTSHWLDPNAGINSVGFNARGAGVRTKDGVFDNLMDLCWLWNAEEAAPTQGSASFLYHDDDAFQTRYGIYGVAYEKEGGLSLRLCRDATEAELLLPDGTQCDDYVGNDLQTYETRKIGTLVWIIYNLAETKYRNGDNIPEVTDASTWAGLTTGARCCYNNDENNV